MKNHTTLYSLLLLVTAMLFASCGTGANFAEETEQDITVNIEEGATNVDLDQSFSMTFGSSVNASSVNASTFFIAPSSLTEASLALKGSMLKTSSDPTTSCDPANAVPGTITYDSTDDCVTNIFLTPTTPLIPGLNYDFCAKPAIKVCNLSVNGPFIGMKRSFKAKSKYEIEVTVSGLGTQETLVLQNNSIEDLTITEDGIFPFATSLLDGADYEVIVATSPSSQVCSIANGTGTINGANIDVQVVCSSSSYTVGGSVSGLAQEGIILKNNGADPLTITSDGTFTFTNEVADLAIYAVTIDTQPAGKTCVLTHGNGTINGAKIENIAVTCSTNSYNISVLVSGLAAQQTVTLQNNVGDDSERSADGSFTFATAIPHGSTYAVTVKTQPNIQTCTVAYGSGTATANVTNVAVTCSTNTYTVGGSVSGLTGTVVLQNNGGDNKTISANGSFTFATSIAVGADYAVTVGTQPDTQTCTVANGSGTMSSANVTSVSVTCVDTFKISGTVSGLNSSLTAENTYGPKGNQQVEELSILQDGAFEFLQRLYNETDYVVTVTPPSNYLCDISNNSGTVDGADVTDMEISCYPAYSITAVVAGLAISEEVELYDGTDVLIVIEDGSFSFDTLLTAGDYLVEVTTQPASQRCTVANDGYATIVNANIEVEVDCDDASPLEVILNGLTQGDYVELELSINQGEMTDQVLVDGGEGSGIFDTQLLDGETYEVTILDQSQGFACSLVGGSGSAPAANPVVVMCSAEQTFTVGGQAIVPGGTLVVQNNAGDDKSIDGPGGQFTFDTPLVDGALYNVTIKTAPEGYNCMVMNGGPGTIKGANIEDVIVQCF